MANFIHITANRIRNNHYEIKRSIIEVKRAKVDAGDSKSACYRCLPAMRQLERPFCLIVYPVNLVHIVSLLNCRILSNNNRLFHGLINIKN